MEWGKIRISVADGGRPDGCRLDGDLDGLNGRRGGGPGGPRGYDHGDVVDNHPRCASLHSKNSNV